jgi:MFS family permease
VFVLYGILVLVGAGPLGDAAPPRRRLLGAAVAGYALAAVVVGLAPKDPPDVEVTVTSQIHVAATIVGGGLILLAMVLVATGAPRRVDRVLAGAVAIFTAVSVVVFRFTWGASFYGLVERCILAPTAIWLAVLATATIVRERRATTGPAVAPGGSG